ncbi:hypothetical protein J7T55_015709 [Diaporthe amygdali]|uniref:uncharacterized protein n=1 Tax=Phomopsis amygdali TaxID=1214568 RepID=UPI0022FEAF4F|nr:uncharacterized protein J7T55_015709 [Diaporthe amygdali]KAJ0120970.1 hypothetical protein J7T55_015709 [Diaporthe amygdali]
MLSAIAIALEATYLLPVPSGPRGKYGLSKYTLPVSRTRIHVANTTASSLLSASQGEGKTANDIMAVASTEDHVYLMSIDKAIHLTVSPKPALHVMNRA